MRPVSMELVVPCNSCTSLHRTPPLHPRVSSLKRSAFSLKCRRTTTSELQSPVSVTSRDGSLSPSIPTHKVTVHDRFRGVVHEFVVPEDQYILHTAESQNITLPFACRHVTVIELNLPIGLKAVFIVLNEEFLYMAGCCTSCAVRVKSGQIRQPEALGISAELKAKA
ncbi:hypothetical protein Gohar_005499 [Gossypium harknessii]|uniref:2Fe-2S ferredoxin-type domain-containing protein n=1 Tax=Gossypium harknessii TaxID=34285 RepID=A0A7J9H9H8_9ROSI|nr:hypothetical protein [Gossypium harknessii]